MKLSITTLTLLAFSITNAHAECQLLSYRWDNHETFQMSIANQSNSPILFDFGRPRHGMVCDNGFLTGFHTYARLYRMPGKHYLTEWWIDQPFSGANTVHYWQDSSTCTANYSVGICHLVTDPISLEQETFCTPDDPAKVETYSFKTHRRAIEIGILCH